MKKEKDYSLLGIDGNVFSVMGYVSKAMRSEGKSKEEIDGYKSRAMSSDYDNAIRESMAVLDELNNED
jgi:hypothetical protein